MDPTIANEPLVPYTYEANNVASDLPPLPNLVNKRRNMFRNSTFHHFGAIKLANIDAVTKITGHIRSFLNPQFMDSEEDGYYFLDLGSGKGGFTEYIIYRRAFSKGGGITLGNENEYDNTLNYTACRGGYGDGDLLADPENVTDFYKQRQAPFHLVMADALVDEQPIGYQYFHLPPVEDVSAPNNDSNVRIYSKHPLHYTQYELMEAEVYIAMKLLRKGGSFVLRLSNPTNWKEAALVYETSRHFGYVYLFRPLTAEEGEIYFVGKEFDYNDSPKQEMTTSFVEWFLTAAENSVNLLPATNIDKCYLQWGLPSGSYSIKMTPKTELAYGNFKGWKEGKRLNELYTFTLKNSFPRTLKEGKVEIRDHLYEITTMRGTQVTLSRVRVDAYAKLVSWEYLFDVIDWYVPFGFVGFCTVDSTLVDLYANPFTRGCKRWTSYYHEEGSESLDKRKKYQTYIPAIKECLDRVNELNINIIVYAPYWPSHPLFKRLKNITFEDPCLWNYATSEKYIPDATYIRAEFS